MGLSAGLLLGCTSGDDGGTTSTTPMTSTDTSGSESTGGDGDGDMMGTTTTTTTGDGDGDPPGESAYGIAEVPCDWLEPEPVAVGDNPILVANDLYVVQTCGAGVGSMAMFVFTAPEAGNYAISISEGDFEATVSTLGYFCEPAVERGCTKAPSALTESLDEGEAVYIAVSSEATKDGTATLSIVKE